MSLINQVLNDLERRGASTNMGDTTIQVVAIKHSYNMLVLRLVALALLIFGVIAWMKWGVESPIKKSPSRGMEAAQSALLIPASPPLATTTEAMPTVSIMPVISAVYPTPVYSFKGSQPISIIGNHFTDDAIITLRSPKGQIYTKRNFISKSGEEIIFNVNFPNIAGLWRVEVSYKNAEAKTPVVASQLATNQFEFLVQLKPDSPRNRKQETVATPSALVSDGISKQPTQITPHQQAENEYRKAYSLMQQGQISAAITRCEAALQLDASHLLARQTLAHLLLDTKRNSEAERVLQAGLQLDLKQPGLAMLLARVQVARNELELALETLQKTLPHAQQQADYQAYIAALLQRQNRHHEAISYFQHAIQLSPQSGVWWMGLGISLHAEKRDEEARDAFKHALDSNKLNAELTAFVTQQLKEM